MNNAEPMFRLKLKNCILFVLQYHIVIIKHLLNSIQVIENIILEDQINLKKKLQYFGSN